MCNVIQNVLLSSKARILNSVMATWCWLPTTPIYHLFLSYSDYTSVLLIELLMLFWFYWYNQNNLAWSGIGQCIIARTYSEPSQTSKTDLFAKILFSAVICFWEKCHLRFLDFCQSSKCTSGICSFCLYCLGSVFDSSMF